MPFKPGNGAGTRRLTLTEDDLRRVILLPAVRQLHLFLRRFRDGLALRELAAESGRTLPSTQSFLNRAAHAVGVEKGAFRGSAPAGRGWFKQVGDGDSERTHLMGQWAGKRQYRFDSKRAEQYFLAPALRMFQVAKLYFVERKSEPELIQVGVGLM